MNMNLGEWRMGDAAAPPKSEKFPKIKPYSDWAEDWPEVKQSFYEQ